MGYLIFVYLVLSKRIDDVPRELHHPLEVEIADECTVRVSRVHQVCILEIFSGPYRIDLVSILIHESEVIVRMDWLCPVG